METAAEAIETLRAEEANTSCAELVAVLEGLGFEVRRRRSGNHHTLDHPGIPCFTGANFDGGHGKTVKRPYVQAMRKLIQKYESELNDYLKGQK